ncbi:hypothetical protein LXL04_001645 [Taraxacum kok-saghyz]
MCKCSISNNPSTIKNHDLGPRHKDNLAKMSNMKEEKAAKDKEKKKSARVLTLTQIEEKASRSNKNGKTRDSNATTLGAQTKEGLGDISTMVELSGDWQRDMSLGYYYNQTNCCYYDPNSGFYYTDALGKWVTLKEVLDAIPKLSSGPTKSQTSEIGQHHKDNVTKRPSNKRVAKDKKKKKKKKAGEVEEKETHIYENDTSAFHETSLDAQTSNEGIDDSSTMFGDWEHDMLSGYYYNLNNGCFYDPNSGLFYTHHLGKWVTLKEALAATSVLTSKSQPLPQSVNGPSSLLKALEIERKRVEEREKEGILPIRFTYSRRRKE